MGEWKIGKQNQISPVFPLKRYAPWVLSLNLAMTTAESAPKEDPYLWLEDVEGEKALDWVREQNKISQAEIEAHPEFRNIQEQTLKILQSDDRIPYFRRRGEYLYNFWQDAKHTRGIWRRTTWSEYAKEDPKWETVLDIDALAEKENANWVYKGVEVLEPSLDLAILRLSPGGKDASVYREFSIPEKKFVEGGFELKEAKSDLTWLDKDTTLVSTDFGEGTLTESGYPRIVKLWKRGQPLCDAKTLFEGEKSDVGCWPFTMRNLNGTYGFIRRSMTFYKGIYYHVNLTDGSVKQLDLPEDARVSDLYENQLLLRLKSDWEVCSKQFGQGDLVSLNFNELLAGNLQPTLVHRPDQRSSIASTDVTADGVLVNLLSDVSSKLLHYKLTDGKWQNEEIATELSNGVIYTSNTSFEHSDFVLSFQNQLTPSTQFHLKTTDCPPNKLKQEPSWFDSENLQVQQNWATSKDGTKVPYFLVSQKDLKLNGKNPTLLYAYGGFEISMRPWYNSTLGSGWLSRGGVYVLANIRGGGEFGPKWHQSALKTNRNKAYEDFFAIAEDLIAEKVTSPQHLGIQGGSNGGLLTGVAFTKRPDLFNGVVCQVPLLDMKRYDKLLAGHSWVAEYGDPDEKEIWKFWQDWSPYQNVFKDKKYPKVLITTSTKDDRVHPGHARKMVARMKEQGHPVLYYENIEGGHAGAANLKQRAYSISLAYAYLLQQLQSSH